MSVAVLAISQLIALYVLIPGRFPSTFSAFQPDSAQYLCFGLKLSGLPPFEVDSISQNMFKYFGYYDAQCFTSSGMLNIYWTVYPRLLLPSLVALASFIGSGAILLAPSILIFFAFITTWLILTVPKGRPLGISDWLISVTPLLAFSMIIWVGSVLTEGPFVFLCLLVVGALIYKARLGLPAWLLGIVLLGLLILLTRQSWPIVGAAWTAASISFVNPWADSKKKRYTRVGSWILISAATALSFAAAKIFSSFVEHLAVPLDLKSSQPPVPEGLPTDFTAYASLVRATVVSTLQDVGVSISRGDVVSPVLLLTALLATVAIARQRQWAVLIFTLSLWFLGSYSVGLVGYYGDAYGTHYRFLVPAVFASLAAWRAGELSSFRQSKIPD